MKIGSTGQLVIPKDFIRRQGWTAGTEVEVLERADGLVVRPKTSVPPVTQATNVVHDDDLAFAALLDRHAGSADAGLTTDEIMQMTRDQD